MLGSESPAVISLGKMPGCDVDQCGCRLSSNVQLPLPQASTPLTAIWLTMILSGRNSLAMTLLSCGTNQQPQQVASDPASLTCTMASLLAA